MGSAAALASLAVALLSLAYTIWDARQGRKQKQIAWSVIQDQPLQPATAAFSDLHLLWRDQMIVDPHLISVQFSNMGRVVLTPEDLSSPLAVRITGAVIVSARAELAPRVSVRSKQIQVKVPEGSTAEVETNLFLNPGDDLRFYVLADGKVEGIHAELHAADFSLVSKEYAAENNPRLNQRIALFAATTVSSLTAIAAFLINFLAKRG